LKESPSPCWRYAAACDLTTRYFSGFLPVDPGSVVGTVAKFGLIDGAVVSLNISVTEDGKKGGASSGLGIARTVEPTEVAATAQQGALTPGAQSDWRAAAETVAEGSEDWQMGNAGAAAAAAAAGGAAED